MENATLIVLALMAIAGIVLVIRAFLKPKAKEPVGPQYRRTPNERLTISGDDPTMDPMDPHGDGTIRPGDPMWDVFLKTMEGDGNVVIGNRREDGDFDLEVYPMEDEPSSTRELFDPIPLKGEPSATLEDMRKEDDR